MKSSNVVPALLLDRAPGRAAGGNAHERAGLSVSVE
jgi:hypothetical protein